MQGFLQAGRQCTARVLGLAHEGLLCPFLVAAYQFNDASVITNVAATKGSATDQRRGAQAARGAPITDQTTGAPISTPKVSPTHQAAQVVGAAAQPTVPLASSATSATLALVRHASGTTSSMKRATSDGSDSSKGWATKRRSAQAPRAACAAAPRAVTPQVATTAGAMTTAGASDHKLAAHAASATANSAGQPQTKAAANATPAAGNNGDALPGWIANSRPSRAVSK